ncbi:encapsulin [Streptomyces cinereoruber]|uniref:encapsulin n=1 Tax=Streptomyces cinereoruber TaxID=67260 RepID=UPI00363827B0
MTTPEDTTDPHREPAPIAPITPAARSGTEEEAHRTFRRHVTGRRAVNPPDPAGPALAVVVPEA